MLYIIKSWKTQIGGLSIYCIMYSHPTDGYNIYKGQEGNQECPVRKSLCVSESAEMIFRHS
jgi:hypothetical protein